MPEKLTEETAHRIAFLARIKLSGGEAAGFAAQMSSILDYMEKLNRLDTKNIEPTSHVVPIENVMRKDKAGKSLPVEESLRNAPDRHLNYFKVPGILYSNES
jgi:aspartyl-tRNA(Asn)/glutamyl-tRNA(Gln) amidotransferase subunit C